MRAARRRSIEANLFPAALDALEPWDRFPWHAAAGEHCDTFKEHSSQALAIDVFGTLKVQPDRDAVLDSLALRLGLPAGGPWQLDLEWQDPDNLLHEKKRTQVDAAARSGRTLILFECKFSESDGGSCSQTHRIAAGAHRGLVQCNGHYELQVNPANGRAAHCALAAKGIEYWHHIPTVFGFDPGLSHSPCPFAGPWFQWMRNLTTAYAIARRYNLRAAFVIVYADGPGLPMAERLCHPGLRWFESQVNPAAVRFTALSYQEIIALARQTTPANSTWPELATWVERKISSVCSRLSPLA